MQSVVRIPNADIGFAFIGNLYPCDLQWFGAVTHVLSIYGFEKHMFVSTSCHDEIHPGMFRDNMTVYRQLGKASGSISDAERLLGALDMLPDGVWWIFPCFDVGASREVITRLDAAPDIIAGLSSLPIYPGSVARTTASPMLEHAVRRMIIAQAIGGLLSKDQTELMLHSKNIVCGPFCLHISQQTIANWQATLSKCSFIKHRDVALALSIITAWAFRTKSEVIVHAV